MSAKWTTSDDIAARVRRRWDDGSLLSTYANGGRCNPASVFTCATGYACTGTAGWCRPEPLLRGSKRLKPSSAS